MRTEILENSDLFYFEKELKILSFDTKISLKKKKKKLENIYLEAYKNKLYSFLSDNINLFYKNEYIFNKNDIILIYYLTRSNLFTENFKKNIQLKNLLTKIKDNTKLGKAIHHNIALSMIKNNDFIDSINILENIKNKNIYHLLDLADAYSKLKNIEKSKELYIKLIKKNDDTSKLLGYFSLGELAIKENNIELLKNCYNKSILLFSNNFEDKYRCTRLFLLYKFSKKLNLAISKKYLEMAISTDAREPEDIYQKKLALKEMEETKWKDF